MAENDSTGTILKILSGVQSGVDVMLHDGEYTLGSGDEDDIQLFDVSLKPSHARLAIRAGKIEIKGVAGQLRTGNGLTIEPGGEFQAIEPLDIVSAGTTRFALGARTANWTTIADAEGDPAAAAPRQKPKKPRRLSLGGTGIRSWQTAVVVAVLLLIGLGFGVRPFYSGKQRASAEDLARSELEIVRASVAGFDFGRRLDIRQEVDGAIYLTGFVEEPVERRAILGAIRETDIPVRVRVAVLDLIRNEVAHLLEEENADVTFTLSETGDLTLRGVILDDERAGELAEIVSEDVSGLSSVNSEIRTATSLLADVRSLADLSQIHPLVLLRLDGELIEASGVIPTEKIDSWAGFLQAYSSQFAALIPLRSFVQLQRPDGSTVPAELAGTALFLGEGEGRGGDLKVDIERLRSGAFELADVFIGQERTGVPTAQAGNEQAGGSNPAGTDLRPLALSGLGSRALGTASNRGPIDIRSILYGEEADVRNIGGPVPERGGWRRLGEGGSLSMAQQAIERWKSGSLDESEEARFIKNGLEALQSYQLSRPGSGIVPIIEYYATLLAKAGLQGQKHQSCWRESHLTSQNLMDALFWLDVLSVSTDLSVIDLEEPLQALVLEAALNPGWTEACLSEKHGDASLSVYLNEISRNPDFVRYVTRDLAVFPLDVSGANVTGKRYVQTRFGRKLHQGSAPDEASRLLLVGELGVAVERESGLSTFIFDSNLNWLIK